MTARLVLATGNPHKVEEMRAILADAGLDPALLADAVVGLPDDAPDVVESGVTFEANALLKARSAAAHTGLPALADDSGLAVDVLGGAPGVFSARWSGVHGQDARNVELLLGQLGDVPDEHRGAAFVCAIALVLPGGQEHVEHGELRGALARATTGDGGFGYDPVFWPTGGSGSLAEYPAVEKNRISHRSQALRAVVPRLVALLTDGPATHPR